MSERDTYPAGVPCWITGLQRDVPAARDFYEQLFGWQTVGPDGIDRATATYAIARMRGRDVAGIGTMPASAGDMPATWMTEIRTDQLEATVRAVEAAGGTVLEPNVDFGDIGRLGVFTDPAGAPFCAWEGGIREGAQIVNEPGAWSMSALRTPDPDAAIAFYGSVFGWQPEPFGPVHCMRLAGYVGGEPSQPVPRDVVAVIVPAESGEPASWGVDFWVRDASAAIATATRVGGSVLAGPYDAPPAFVQAVLADPEGAVFTVSQLVTGAETRSG
jgi:uncharacterized protein